MGYTMKTEGLDEVSTMLTQLGDKAEKVASSGLYDGAGVMADEVKRQADSIQDGRFHYSVFPGATTRLPSYEEKQAVVNAGAGVAKFDKNGSEVNTSVGYSNAGYTYIAGKKKPIPLIANAINSGTSFMKKQPFFRKAVSRGTRPAEEAIINRIEERFDELIKQSGG